MYHGCSSRMAAKPHSPGSAPVPLTDDALLELGRQALLTEAQAVSALVPRLDRSFALACRLCLDCKGRVIVTGMGKSGHIASKIAATLSSTGTPAFFLHPAEASPVSYTHLTLPTSDLV